MRPRDALAEALDSHSYGMEHCDAGCADAILAHPAVVAALSEPAGLREAQYVTAYVEDRDRYIREALVERVGDMVGRQAALDVVDAAYRAALAATPTASPTEPER